MRQGLAAPAQSDTPSAEYRVLFMENEALKRELSALRAKQSSEVRAVVDQCLEICYGEPSLMDAIVKLGKYRDRLATLQPSTPTK